MIEFHLKRFKQLFPDNNVIPKQHYMLHLPAQVLSLGPLIRHMCMRLKSRNCIFKQWSSKLNFKNVCKSLANRDQLFECCQNELGSEHPMFGNCVLCQESHIWNTLQQRWKICRDWLCSHAVAVKWLILNSNVNEKSLIITSANGKVTVFGTFML